MSVSEEVSTYVASISGAETQLQTALAALRIAAKAVNDLGALASSLQRDAQDMEYAPIDPTLKSFLDGSYIQRTGFVNKKAGEVAEQLRQLSRGVTELMADGGKATALASPTVVSGI